MATSYKCIKTYTKGQYWDEELGQNVKYKEPEPRAYAADDDKPPTDYDRAGDELDKLARELIAASPGTPYIVACGQVLAANPDLKAAYGGIK